MFKANKSLFKPIGSNDKGENRKYAYDDQKKSNTPKEHEEAEHGKGVGEQHPHHAGGEGYHKIEHKESGHVHEISHHEDGIHHSISHPDHGSHFITHNHGENSQLNENMGQESGDSLASEYPEIP